MWIFLIVLPLFGVVLACVLYRYFRKILLFPTERLVAHIHQLEGGADALETERQKQEKTDGITEFQEIGSRIDEMVGRIGELQDHLYREKLERQIVQMQCFQLQIKPHFYLNCLKEMDALLETGDYQAVRPFVICLAEYIRGRFQKTEELAPLRDELRATYSYYCLRTMLYSRPVLYRDEVPEELKGLLVPPFCVQLLVENSFKYAHREGQILSVRIQASRAAEAGRECLMLRVSDNGEGYRKEQIREWMRDDMDVTMRREHIGILNLIVRLRLLYQDAAKAVFYNQPSGGAVTELILPVRTKKAADCRETDLTEKGEIR